MNMKDALLVGVINNMMTERSATEKYAVLVVSLEDKQIATLSAVDEEGRSELHKALVNYGFIAKE